MRTSSNKLNVDRVPAATIRRIGLLSPTSGNLGNATMQAAMIANVRKRIAGVEFLGITLNPDETYRRHGIGSFPLAAVSRPYYGLYNSSSATAEPRKLPRAGRVKRWLKKVPVVRNILTAVRTCLLELDHIISAARVVRKLDRVIVPGGGALDDFWGGPWGQPWALFKWNLLCRVYGVPFLFVSIGKCSLESSLSRFFARRALRLAKYRSYRDPVSKVAVQGLIDTSGDQVYPDLAFSYLSPPIQPSHAASREARLVVGVSPIAYCDPRAWPSKDERRYAAYVSELAKMVNWLISEGCHVRFFTTDTPDTATVQDVQSLISASAMRADKFQTLASSTEQSPESLLKEIADVDLTIASRLHGVILSHLNATPVLALSFDPKVDAHMSEVGQKDYCLDIDHLRLETLIERFTALKAARQREQDRLRSAGLRFRNLLDVQYDRILFAPHSSSITIDDPNEIYACRQAEVGRYRTKS